MKMNNLVIIEFPGRKKVCVYSLKSKLGKKLGTVFALELDKNQFFFVHIAQISEAWCQTYTIQENISALSVYSSLYLHDQKGIPVLSATLPHASIQGPVKKYEHYEHL